MNIDCLETQFTYTTIIMWKTKWKELEVVAPHLDNLLRTRTYMHIFYFNGLPVLCDT